MAKQETLEGTTGGNYLTKSYLVRNLKIFWGKIKEYIASQISVFAKTEDVQEALDGKANQTDLNSLTTEVSSKVNSSEFDALERIVQSKVDPSALTEITTALDGKVNKEGNKVLSDNNFETKYKTQLDNLENATEVKDGLLSAEDKRKLDELVTNAVTEVDTQLNQTSINPVQNQVICAELAKKVDIEELLKPSDLLSSGLDYEQSSKGDIILSFPKNITHIKIHTEDGYFIEKFNITLSNSDSRSINFNSCKDGNTTVIIPNPDGTNLPSSKIYRFYVEYLELSGLEKYKPFILKVTRNGLKPELLELDVFEN